MANEQNLIKNADRTQRECTARALQKARDIEENYSHNSRL